MIIATAGHVDHGKTSLVKHLTGVETDSLEEEKRRGLSINLGYAYLHADADTTIGFIDVPGHSRFINTMISGVSSIDLALVVVAANEGPMPQTVEHLEVLRLLGIRQYVIVITYIDRVEAPQVKEVAGKMQDILGLESPVFKVNNIDGAGTDDLKNHLFQEAIGQADQTERGYFRLSIDRKFLVKGVGLIVTGTAISGRVSEGDKLFLLPENIEVRVRAIHAQNEKSSVGRIGQRCALQLSGVEKVQIKRGDWLNASSENQVSNRLNVRLKMSGRLTFKIKHLCPVKLYIGAKLVTAKLYLLERKTNVNQLRANDHVFAQLIIDGQISCCRGDRFILRDSSETTTLGGGMVLEPHAIYSPKLTNSAKDYLLAMEAPTLEETLTKLLIEQQRIVNVSRLKQDYNLKDADLEPVLHNVGLLNEIRAFFRNSQKYLLSNKYWKTVEQSIIDHVHSWHADNPNALGIQPDHLLARLRSEIDQNLFWNILDDLVERAGLIRVNGFVRLLDFKPKTDPVEMKKWKLIEEALSQYKRQIPTLANLKEDLMLDAKTIELALQKAVKEGRVHSLNGNRFVVFKQLRLFAHEVSQLANENPYFSVVEVKNSLGMGRNSCIQLLEYFDHIGFTRRYGERRAVIDKELLDRMFTMT